METNVNFVIFLTSLWSDRSVTNDELGTCTLKTAHSLMYLHNMPIPPIKTPLLCWFDQNSYQQLIFKNVDFPFLIKEY